MVNKISQISQSIQPRIANRKFFHTIRESTLSIMSNTLTLLRNHGRPILQMVCHWLTPMFTISGPSTQFIQLRTANPRSFHITRESTPSMMSSTPTLPRNLGKLILLTVCLLRELMHRSQFIQLRIASLRSFHITKESMLSMMSNTPTPLRRDGRQILQMVCHSLELMPRDQVESTQLRIASLRFSHTTRETTLSTMSNTLTLLRRDGRLILQMVCHLLVLMLNLSKSKASSSLCQLRKPLIDSELKLTPRLSHM